jgi:hypothetical protein
LAALPGLRLDGPRYEMPLSPVVEHGQAMPIAATKSVRIEPAVEHD